MCSVLLYCPHSVTAYLHHLLTCRCAGYQDHPGMGGFPGIELTNFPNVGGAWKGISSAAYDLFRRSVDATVFAVCQMSEFHGQHAFSSLRTLIRTRSFGGQGCVKGVKRCIQLLPRFGIAGCVYMQFLRCQKVHSSASSVWHRGLRFDAIFIIPPQFKVSTTSGCVVVVRTETQQLPLAFEC